MADADRESRKVRVVELPHVDADSMENAINEMLEKNYDLTAVHFAMRDASRRPSMAFLVFHLLGDEE